MRRALLAAVLTALAAPLPARAGDPPAEPAAVEMKPRARIENAFLLGLVGSWDVAVKFVPDGVHVQPATARWTTALDGTALVEELSMKADVSTYTVLCVGADGTSVTRWWFHTSGGAEFSPQKGTLGADGFDLKYDGPGGRARTVLKKSGDGFVLTSKLLDHNIGDVFTYTKSAKEAPPAPVVAGRAIENPFVKSSVGDYTLKNTVKMGEMESSAEGTASIRLGLGGAYTVMDYDAKSPEARITGLGLATIDRDGKTLNEWWFSNFFDAPTFLSGELSENSWRGKATVSPHGPFEMSWTRTDTGFDLKATFSNGASVTETYTKKK